MNPAPGAAKKYFHAKIHRHQPVYEHRSDLLRLLDDSADVLDRPNLRPTLDEHIVCLKLSQCCPQNVFGGRSSGVGYDQNLTFHWSLAIARNFQPRFRHPAAPKSTVTAI